MSAEAKLLGRRYEVHGERDMTLRLECQGCGAEHAVRRPDPMLCLSAARADGWQPMDRHLGEVWCPGCDRKTVQGDLLDTEAA